MQIKAKKLLSFVLLLSLLLPGSAFALIVPVESPSQPGRSSSYTLTEGSPGIKVVHNPAGSETRVAVSGPEPGVCVLPNQGSSLQGTATWELFTKPAGCFNLIPESPARQENLEVVVSRAPGFVPKVIVHNPGAKIVNAYTHNPAPFSAPAVSLPFNSVLGILFAALASGPLQKLETKLRKPKFSARKFALPGIQVMRC